MTTRDHSPHRQMNALRLPLCTLLCLWGGASSAVTQSATLEACSSAAGTGLTATICSNRLALDVPVRNGQNETEPVTVAVDSVIDCTSGGGGACTATTLENKVRITLTRTPVYFKYTTAYHSTVNYQKYELATTGQTDSSGNVVPFDGGGTPSCEDSALAAEPSCGWVYDGNGAKVPDSQGYCCTCPESFTPGTGDGTRQDLSCTATSSGASGPQQSSHCLRDDPLYTFGYSIGTVEVFYAVKVEIQICTSSSDAGCRSTNVVLNPDAPSASASDGAFYASLVGDLNAFDPPPDLTNMVLAVPVGSSASNCNGVNDPQRPDLDLNARCASRISAGEQFWMLLHKEDFDTAATGECNSFDVDYSAFQNQPEACGAAVGSCTREQLADYFDADFAKYQANEEGQYFTMFQSALGFSAMTVDEAHGVSMMQQGIAGTLVFDTLRHQPGVLHLEINADAFTLSSSVASGSIVETNVGPFPANSMVTTMTVTYRNDATGPGVSQNAQFVVALEACSTGIISPGAEVSSVLSGQSQVATFELKRQFAVRDSSSIEHTCNVVLYDAQGAETDRTTVSFETTAVAASQDATTEFVFVNPYSPDDVCTCSFMDVVCYTTSLADCTSTITILASAVGAAIILCFCVSFCLCGCCCGKKGKKGCCTALAWILCCPCMCLCSAIPKMFRTCLPTAHESDGEEEAEEDDGNDHDSAEKKYVHKKKHKNNAVAPSRHHNRSSGKHRHTGSHRHQHHHSPPPEWSEQLDPETGSTYFYNGRTGATTWERPDGMVVALEKSTQAQSSVSNDASTVISAPSSPFQCECAGGSQLFVALMNKEFGPSWTEYTKSRPHDHLEDLAARAGVEVFCHECHVQLMSPPSAVQPSDDADSQKRFGILLQTTARGHPSSWHWESIRFCVVPEKAYDEYRESTASTRCKTCASRRTVADQLLAVQDEMRRDLSHRLAEQRQTYDQLLEEKALDKHKSGSHIRTMAQLEDVQRSGVADLFKTAGDGHCYVYLNIPRLNHNIRNHPLNHKRHGWSIHGRWGTGKTGRHSAKRLKDTLTDKGHLFFLPVNQFPGRPGNPFDVYRLKLSLPLIYMLISVKPQFEVPAAQVKKWTDATNDAGYRMFYGHGNDCHTLYCGRWLGMKKMPDSRGCCGPIGPQCPECFTAQQRLRETHKLP